MYDTGFGVTIQVVVDGHVEAAADLLREGSDPSAVQTVRKEGFASTLFTPAEPKPKVPAIVVIGGSEGGEDRFTANALATIGYPALALGYFDEPGLPPCLCDIPLEYFARAVRWLRAQPVARGRPIILYGVSRGGEGALLIASHEPHLFSAVIASSPSAFINEPTPGHSATMNVHGAWTWHGRALQLGSQIPVWKIRVPLLIGAGGQDAIWNAGPWASLIMSELRASHDAAPHIELYFPKAGHAILGAPPFFPYSGFLGHDFAMGGSRQANALAEEQSWARMIEFIDNPWRR
jgi:dienelactone hydrolase